MSMICIDVLQGSVATCLQCGGIFYYCFAGNLLVSLSVKFFFWKLLNRWQS